MSISDGIGFFNLDLPPHARLVRSRFIMVVDILKGAQSLTLPALYISEGEGQPNRGMYSIERLGADRNGSYMRRRPDVL
jgi:hypothetical protein